MNSRLCIDSEHPPPHPHPPTLRFKKQASQPSASEYYIHYYRTIHQHDEDFSGMGEEVFSNIIQDLEERGQKITNL